MAATPALNPDGVPAYDPDTGLPVYTEPDDDCCFVQELKCEDDSANGVYWAKMSSFDTTKIYKDGSTCVYYGTEKRACLPDGATERMTAVSAPYDSCADCADVCGETTMCPGGLPSSLTITGLFEVSTDGGLTWDSTTFTATVIVVAPDTCDWEADTPGESVDGYPATINNLSGGVDGLGGGGWSIVPLSDTHTSLSKCGLTPLGTYAGTVTDTIDGGAAMVRYSNMVVA